MDKKDQLSKILAVAGTVLVWIPSLAPLVIALFALGVRGVFLYDYLMPAELFPVALVGGGLLFWAAFRTKTLHKAIGVSFILAAALLVAVNLIATATGLASGETVPGGWAWALVIGVLIAYTLDLLSLGIEGAGLVRWLFRPRRTA